METPNNNHPIKLNDKDKRGCLYSFLLTISLLTVIVLVCIFVLRKKDSERRYYDDHKVFAFELVESNQGANHYGEIESYKFFSDGTGLHLFESWHDSSECYEPDCNLRSETNVSTFEYQVVDHQTVEFDKDSFYDSFPVIIKVNPDSKEISVSEDYYSLFLKEESVNWEEVNKMLQR